MGKDCYKIGDVYWMEFSGVGNEQRGIRPGIVFQNNVGNQRSPNIIALPTTTNLKKLRQPTHVLLESGSTGMPKDSIVLCENPERMSKEKIGDFITSIPESNMAEIAAANLIATSAIAFIDPKSLYGIWLAANRLNDIV